MMVTEVEEFFSRNSAEDHRRVVLRKFPKDIFGTRTFIRRDTDGTWSCTTQRFR